MKIVAYCRVSTNMQADNGHSLKSQESAIRQWAKASGHEVLAVHVEQEGVSGRAMKGRPALRAALSDAIANKAVFVVHSLSRATRSLSDALEIMRMLGKGGADFLSLSEAVDTTSAMGKAFMHIVAVLSELERNLIGERTAATMKYLRKNGKRISRHIPYGSALAADGETLVWVTKEQNAIRLMQKMRDGGSSLKDIAETLTRKHYLAKQGGRNWTPAVILRILRRAKVESVTASGPRK